MAPLQTDVLDPLCTNTNQQVCLSLLTADSTTTTTSSSNRFALARGSVLGLGFNAADSEGAIGADGGCQTATGTSRVATVIVAGGGAVGQVADSASSSRSCGGQAAVVTKTSHVIGLGGVQVPIPAAGCASGAPDTLSGVPAVLPVVCNADDSAGAAAVREALDAYVLQVGTTSLAKQTAAAAEASSVAPADGPVAPPIQCRVVTTCAPRRALADGVAGHSTIAGTDARCGAGQARPLARQAVLDRAAGDRQERRRRPSRPRQDAAVSRRIAPRRLPVVAVLTAR